MILTKAFWSEVGETYILFKGKKRINHVFSKLKRHQVINPTAYQVASYPFRTKSTCFFGRIDIISFKS